MKKNSSNLIILCMIFAVSLVISNVVTGKLIDIPINLFGGHIQLPGAALCYAVTFLMTDVIGEVWGKKERICASSSAFSARFSLPCSSCLRSTSRR